MNSLFIGLYGVYLLAVGIRGNGGALADLVSADAPKYFPWLLAIIVISVLTEFDATKNLVKPIIMLLVLNFVLRNFDTIKSEVSKIYTSSQGAKNAQ